MRYIIGGVERPSRGWYLTLLAALVVLALAGLSVGRMLRLPYDGTDWAPDAWRPDGLRVTPSQPVSGGLQPGDVVTAVGGTPLEAWARALLQPAFPRPRWQTGQVVTYTLTRNGVSLDVPVSLIPFPVGQAIQQHWGHVLTLLAFQIVGTFVFLRRPDDGAARVFFLAAWCGFAATANWLFGLHVVDIVDGLRFWLFRVTGQGTGLLFSAALLHFTLIFPRLLPIIQKHRRIVPVIYGLPYVLYVGNIVLAYFRSENTLVWLGTWTAGARPVFLGYAVLTAAAILAQYWSGSSTVGRRQIRWVMLAVWISVGGFLVLYLLPVLITGRPVIDASAQGIIALPIPLALMIAIWRYQLFDIDTLLNRAMVYGALTACVVAIYALVVGYLGTLLEVRARPVVSLIAAGIIAVLLQPLRERLQRAVNRWMFGQRDEPYRVLARLGQRLEAAFEPAAILPTLVQTVRESLKLPYVGIDLGQHGSIEIAAASGTPSAESVPFPIVYQGITVGQLLVSPRWDEAVLSAADRRLLADLAQQAGAAVHGVRLMADLQRLTADLRQSRERLVLAREEERRRLRRDLHDDLAPTLAGLSLTAETISDLIPTDPDKAADLACDLHTAIRDTVGNIRRLVYDLRPPALDQFGLLAAIHERAAQFNGYRDGARVLNVTVDAPAELPPLPAAVEVAAYRIVQEALMNVVKHAQAEHCHIRLTLGDALTLDISDDGVGLGDTYSAGIGLHSMGERAEELGGMWELGRTPGGKTRITVRLPLTKERSYDADSSADH